MNLEDLTLDVEQSVEMKADIGDVFERVLFRFGEGNTDPSGNSLDLRLEQWAGGRWFRDRGQGIQHLWGHVQVIKPPTLIEISGPMFMSYPAINHIEIRLEKVSAGTRVALRHRAIGMIEQAHREGISTGWLTILNSVRSDFEPAAKGTA